MAANTWRPSMIEVALTNPTFLDWYWATGVGGARNRMKMANFSMALRASAGSSVSVLVKSLGTVANWHDGFSSRSLWNSSLVMPISTL